MSANINIVEGKASLMLVKEPAWHGLGTIVPERVNSADAIKIAGLDYEVGKRPVEILIPGEKEHRTIAGRFGTYRKDTGTPFGVVGSRYEIVQNRDAFDFFDAIVGKGEAIYETAGALFNGEVVFITAKLPDYIKVGNGDNDLIEQYIFLKSTHDGSGAITAAFSPVRIVCSNTMAMALVSCSNKVSIRHTKDAKKKLEEAHKIMGISNKLSVELGEIFNQMTKVKITDKELRKFIEDVMMPPKKETMTEEEYSTRFKNTVNEIYAYAMTNETQQGDSTRGNLWGCVNSISGYYQNLKTYKNAEKKLYDIMDGTAAMKTQLAFDKALILLS